MIKICLLSLGAFLLSGKVVAVGPCELPKVRKRFLGLSASEKRYAIKVHLSGCVEHKEGQSDFDLEVIQWFDFKNKIRRQYLITDRKYNLKLLKTTKDGRPYELDELFKRPLLGKKDWNKTVKEKRFEQGRRGRKSPKGNCLVSLNQKPDEGSAYGGKRVSLLLSRPGSNRTVHHFGTHSGDLKLRTRWFFEGSWLLAKLEQRKGWAPGASEGKSGEYFHLVKLKKTCG